MPSHVSDLFDYLHELRPGHLTPVEQVRNHLMVTKETVRIEKLLQSRVKPDQILSLANALEETVTSLIGANIGSMGALGSATATPLVAAGRGASYFRKLLNQLPAARTPAPGS